MNSQRQNGMDEKIHLQCIKVLNTLLGREMTGEVPHYDALLPYAETQSIRGLISSIASKDERLPHAMRVQYAMGTWVQQQRDLIQQQKLRQLLEMFRRHGLHCVPIKGQRVRLAYPDPSLRGMGDIDLLCPMEDRKRILELASAQGYRYQGNRNKHRCLPGGYAENDTVSDGDGFIVELHYCLFPILYLRHPSVKDFLTKGVRKEIIEENGEERLTRNAEFLVMILHIASHLVHKGIGIRYFLDVQLYRKKYEKELNMGYIREAISSMGMKRFYNIILYLAEEWFPLDSTSSEKKPVIELDALKSLVLNRGTFGNKSDRFLFGRIKLSLVYQRMGKVLKVHRLLFPPLYIMRTEYPILNRMKILYPFLCIFHDAKSLVLRMRRRSIGKILMGIVHIRKDMKDAKDEAEMLDKIGL